MTSPARIGRHPIHPMLVAFPIGLWVFSVVCDLIHLLALGGAVWNEVAFYTMAGGIAGALLAALPGLIDLVFISDPKVKSIGIWHMVINLLAVTLFALNLWLRTGNAPSTILPFTLSVVGIILIGLSGWLGGEMVYVHGVAVLPQPDTKTGRNST